MLPFKPGPFTFQPCWSYHVRLSFDWSCIFRVVQNKLIPRQARNTFLRVISNSCPIGHRLRFATDADTSCPSCGRYEDTHHLFFACPIINHLPIQLHAILSQVFKVNLIGYIRYFFIDSISPTIRLGWDLLFCTYIHEIWKFRNVARFGDSPRSAQSLAQTILAQLELHVQVLFHSARRRCRFDSGKRLSQLKSTFVCTGLFSLSAHSPASLPILNPTSFSYWGTSYKPSPSSLLYERFLQVASPSKALLNPTNPSPGFARVVLAKRRTPPTDSPPRRGIGRGVQSGLPLGPRVKRRRGEDGS